MERTAPRPDTDTSSLGEALRHLLHDSLPATASEAAVEEMIADGVPKLRLRIEAAVRRAEEEETLAEEEAYEALAEYQALAEYEAPAAEPAEDEAQRLCDH
ncbi:hypothetical protein ACFCZ1_26705 [Streptomyces sp. NPDC056224]|uniref:hypothetical protein n=1 Tax=Streptomyces sp. NPDC056224 TaxID=3345750 RepID=UPI0035DA2C1E